VRFLRLIAPVLISAVALTGCRTDVDVAVRVRPDGAGTVTVTVVLDAEAARQVGDPSKLALSDLTDAGWRVDGPSTSDGGLRIVAVRPFSSPEQLAAVLDEVGGAEGVFSGTSLEMTDGFATSSTSFRTTLTLSGDPAQFSDAALSELLGGLPLARTPEELAAEGATDRDSATLTVRVSLPGGVDESNGEVAKGVATWSASMAGGKATGETLTATASERRTTTWVLVGAGVLLIAVGLVVAVVGRVRRTD